MQDDWWLIPLFEQDLLKDVGNNDCYEDRNGDEEAVDDTFGQ